MMPQKLPLNEANSSTENNPTSIAKIEKPTERLEINDEVDLPHKEDSLLSCTRMLLREYGYRKSGAAVRDAVELPHKNFGPQQAVSALSTLGFKTSFGHMKLGKIKKEFLPAISFLKDGTSVVVKEIDDNRAFVIVSSDTIIKNSQIGATKFKEKYSGYLILAKELNSTEKQERGGHWFFSSFRKSKWIYVQVMAAAMVSNFLSLTTSLFTMTVYDRIIPNGAFESLIALSIGVIIALAFDFVIKGLRARFIDVASKRADLEISRRLFDRILKFTPSEQRQKTGAMAGTIREFETLREFFNSSTLVVLIDLPFVFFFIYVIYLIAGPLAYIPLLAGPLVIIVGLLIQPFLARITKGNVEFGMNKQAVLVETLNGLETVTATGSGKLMKKRYEDALDNQSDGGNKIRVLSNFVINFAASVQQYAQVAAIFFGVYLIVEGTITQGALIGAVILGGRTMAPLSQLANTLARVNGAITSYKNLSKLIGKGHNVASNLSPADQNLKEK